MSNLETIMENGIYEVEVTPRKAFETEKPFTPSIVLTIDTDEASESVAGMSTTKARALAYLILAACEEAEMETKTKRDAELMRMWNGEKLS